MRFAHCAKMLWPIHSNSMRFGVFSYWCLKLLLRNSSGTRPSLVTDLQTNPQWFLEVINLTPFSPSAFNSQQTTELAFTYCMKKSLSIPKVQSLLHENKGYVTQVIKHTKNTMLSQCSDHTSLHLSAVEYTLNNWKTIQQVRAISLQLFCHRWRKWLQAYKSFHCHLTSWFVE